MLELERIIGTNELICQGQRCALNLPSLNDILHIRLNDPDVAEVDLRPVVAEFLRTNKPRKEFDGFKTKGNYSSLAPAKFFFSNYEGGGIRGVAKVRDHKGCCNTP